MATKLKMYTPNEIEEQRQLVLRFIRGMYHPHEIKVKGSDPIFLCWRMRLERARVITAEMDREQNEQARGAKVFAKLYGKFVQYCAAVDEAHAKYVKMCNIANVKIEDLDVRECWCDMCQEDRKELVVHG